MASTARRNAVKPILDGPARARVVRPYRRLADLPATDTLFQRLAPLVANAETVDG